MLLWFLATALLALAAAAVWAAEREGAPLVQRARARRHPQVRGPVERHGRGRDGRSCD